MAAQELTTEDVSNELVELHRLAGLVGPGTSWAALRRTVIKLDNQRRHLQRQSP